MSHNLNSFYDKTFLPWEQLEIEQDAVKLKDEVDLNTTRTPQSADYKELTQEQIDSLKEKYDVKNMSYEEMGAILKTFKMMDF